MFADHIPLLALLTLTGCGGLVGGDYRGEVLLSIEGAVLMDADIDFQSDVGVALLWNNDGEAAIGAQSVVVQTSFPARYTIEIHSEPRQSSLLNVLGVQDFRAAIGQIVLYQDLDGNGAWAGPGREPVVGGAYDSAVVWIPEPNSPESGPSPVDLEPAPAPLDPYVPDIEHWTPRGGFQLVEVPIPPACGLPLSEIFFERVDNRATLHVGGLRNAYYDWDCDGLADYAGEENGFPTTDGPPPDDTNDEPSVSNPWGSEECGPPQVLLSDCEFLESEILNDVFFTDGGAPPPLEDWWLDCMEEYCPMSVQALRDIVGQTSEP